MRFFLLTLWLAVSSVSILAADWQLQSIPPAKQVETTPTGSVWYRAYLRVAKGLVEPSADPKDLWRESMTLALQDIPGPFQVFLNGVSIIKGNKVAADAPHRYKVPKDILKGEVFNTLVIRLEGDAAKQGLTHPPVFGGYLDEVVLDHDWEVLRGEATEADHSAIKEPPSVASYTEKNWRKANTVLAAPDEPVRGKQVPPAEALAKLKTPDDLLVESLLHEPEIAQPTHVSFDERGRLWVAQYRQYPYPAGLKMISRDAYYRGKYDRVPPAPPYHDPGADIVSVHEDRDGDGRYEAHKNVLTGLNMANAALFGHGGIWVMHTPYLLFYPDANGDDVPDRNPEVRLAGFGLEDTHSTANGLIWGPDGWLYGAQGSTVTSHVTRPDVDKADAKPIYLEGCAVWRYHPTTKAFEIFADGSGNTFGLHFDAEGRLFSGHNGGDTRGWHHIQEGLYLKQGTSPDKFGPPTNPFSFGQLPAMTATHPIPRFSHNIIMMEGSALPSHWKGKLLGADPLHQNLVAAERKPVGSTFITTDVGFPVKADDMTFRPVYLANAPDGSITIADFREEYIAHGQNYQGQIDPDSGRLYRLRGKQEALEKDVDLSGKSSADLIKLLDHPNLWHRHTAARLLGQQANADQKAKLTALLDPARAGHDPNHPALEAVWALHQSGQLDTPTALLALSHPGPMVRAWAIRLLGDQRQLDPDFLAAVINLASTEANAEVRAQILSTARRLPKEQALPLVAAILSRDVDTADIFIPLMAWFTLESHCATASDEVVALWEKDPTLWGRTLVRQQITPRLMRRFAAAGTRQDLLLCAKLLSIAPVQDDKTALMLGFEEAFKGRALPPMPDELAQALASQGNGSLLLRVRQREAAALQEALTVLENPKAPAQERLLYARTFGEIAHPPAVAVLLKTCQEGASPELRRLSFSSLTRYDDPAIGAQVVQYYAQLPADIRDAALNLLASRATWTSALLTAIEKGEIPKEAINPELLIRLRLHKEAPLSAQLARLFPAPGPAARENLRPKIEAVRTTITKAPGNPYDGEAIYMERCAACHKLFHKGGNVGPNLTSYQREDLGTMLISIIDPNAEIREGYTNQFITTKDGRTLGGFLADQDANVIVLRGFDGNDITLQRSDIASIQGAGASLMPEGLLDRLTDTQLRDLFAYLRISQPISK